MDKVSIIMPAYNEEKRIEKTLEEYCRYFDELADSGRLDYEIVVVINNTKDRTEEIVKAAQLKNKRLRYLNFKRGGKGFAVVEGFKDALTRKNDLIGFVDADMATAPEEYWRLIRNIGKADGVIASRWMPGAKVYPVPSWERDLARWTFNSLIRILLSLPYKDTQCGAKLFKKTAIGEITSLITMSQWAFDVDLLYSLRKKGYLIKEVPTVWSDKEYSKINFWKAGPRMALEVVRLRIINSPLKFLIRVYDKWLDIFIKFI